MSGHFHLESGINISDVAPNNENAENSLDSIIHTTGPCAITGTMESLSHLSDNDNGNVDIMNVTPPLGIIANAIDEFNATESSFAAAAAASANDQENGLGLGLSLMQSSPPPHSYRHSRAYRHFKNPPQPHMCIRTTTETGEELFINVLSWTRIVIPQEPSDPIPLYGGMRVPPGSPRNPPLVFAVMANPEVLKDSGRHSKDPEERRAMVELMCDFVEAMNPGVKLVRNAVILKDRDISGELKDVWNAVQAQRDREREEQMMQQRQQQHYHNLTTQQMFPKSETGTSIDEFNSNEEMHLNTITPTEEQQSISNELDTASACAEIEIVTTTSTDPVPTSIGNAHNETASIVQQNNELISSDQIDNSITHDLEDTVSLGEKNKNAENKTATNSCAIVTVTDNNEKDIISAKDVQKIPVVTIPPVAVPTKKEKLGGFLPNGCIFPRFKNNKNKDKEKEKDIKVKDKEKTLLNALKKSKEKKVAPLEQGEKTALDNDSKTNYEKNCINLENEVQKLDLNKIDSAGSNERAMFVKLKVSTTSAGGK